MAVVTAIQIRRGTASQWTSANPTLAAGEWGLETDTLKTKIGDGSTAWSSLAYATGSVSISNVTGLGTGVATFLGTPSSSNLAAAVTDETGSGSLVFATSPTLVTPTITQGTSTPSFTTNAYTVIAGDAGKLLLASNSSTAGTVNIPTDATTNFAVGTQITILQTGSGQLTITPTTTGTTSLFSTGATANAPKLRVQYSAITILKTAANTWYGFGDIS
jgi:hypothetical protein